MHEVRRRTLRTDPTVGEVAAAVHEPDGTPDLAVLLTPGAGGDLDGDGLVALAEVLASHGSLVVRSNLPHNEAGRPAPRAERSVHGFTRLFEDACDRIAPGLRWVVGGKSYGGRVASMAVAAGVEALGLVFYGYPLHPPGKPQTLRVDHWPEVTVPTLFLQGSRDPFCDLDLLDANIHRLAGETTLEIVDGGDHSLNIPAKASSDGARHPAPEVLRALTPAITRWAGSLANASRGSRTRPGAR
jgi:uncharacterized protein